MNNQLKTIISGVYKINFPNGKSYIGISSNIKKRIKEHNCDSKNPKYPVHEAIAKYLKVIDFNKDVEILEEINAKDRSYMCEREKYWIEYYQTFIENGKGYNLTLGGDGASTGVNNISAKLNLTELNKIYDLLQNSNKYIYEIAKDFNISAETLSEINNGKRYYNEKFVYPLRNNTQFKKGHKVPKGTKNHLSKFSNEDIDNIYNLLQFSNKSLKNIAKDFNVSYATISNINRGIRYTKTNFNYPIRQGHNANNVFDNTTSQLVIQDIENSLLSLKEIAQKYKVSIHTIRKINQGKKYYNEDKKYPLRK